MISGIRSLYWSRLDMEQQQWESHVRASYGTDAAVIIERARFLYQSSGSPGTTEQVINWARSRALTEWGDREFAKWQERTRAGDGH